MFLKSEMSFNTRNFFFFPRTISTLHFSPGENFEDPPKWLLSGSIDKTLKVWNVIKVERVDQCSLSCSAFHAVEVRPTDQPSNFLIATVGSDNHIQVNLVLLK